MRHFRFTAPLAIALVLSAPLAHAGAGIITTTVTPLSSDITYSKLATTKSPALDTYVGYKIDIANGGGNTINNIRFTATAVVTEPAEKAVFSSAEGATCVTTNADQTAIDCNIGQLVAGQPFPTFVVFFKAPVKVNLTVVDTVNFSGITYYAEGTGGPNSTPQNSTTPWFASLVTLGTSNPTVVKSGVQKTGGTFFTGNGGLSTGTDPFTTSVVVPAGLTYTTAAIDESPYGLVGGCTNFIQCYKSAITIPGTFSPYLTIVLRQDAANIVKGTKIGSVVIRYFPDDLSPAVVVGLCASPTTPRTDGLPCIAKSVYYKSSTVPGWTTDLDGDFEWTLLNIKNGGYNID